jgi:hypothetical protein
LSLSECVFAVLELIRDLDDLFFECDAAHQGAAAGKPAFLSVDVDEFGRPAE